MLTPPADRRAWHTSHVTPPAAGATRRRSHHLDSNDSPHPEAVATLDPQPLQQCRSGPLPAGTISVAAPSPWANPRQPSHHATTSIRAAATCHYAVWIAARLDLLAAARRELAGHDLACSCPTGPCHRDVLIDIANPPVNPLGAGTGLMGLAVRRPWASLLLVPTHLGGKAVENNTFGTDYRGPVAIFASARVDSTGVRAAHNVGLDADWHVAQAGWLGTAVLADVHIAHGYCCAPWGYATRRDRPCYHWVFTHPARLALPTHGHGFAGLRPVAWSALVRRNALGFTCPRKESAP
jgi:hypothetical protein